MSNEWGDSWTISRCDFSDPYDYFAEDPEYARCDFPREWGCDTSEKPFGSKLHQPIIKGKRIEGRKVCWDNIEKGCGDEVVEVVYAWRPMNLQEDSNSEASNDSGDL